jgi:hypothetical protein
MTDTIAEALGVESREIIRPDKVRSLVPANQDEFTRQLVENRRSDYTTVRDNIHNLIAEVELVVSDAVVEVRSNPSARLYETFALLVRTYADLNKDLIATSGPPPSEKDPVSEQSSPVNNVVFVGTSDNLIDHIRGVMK